MFPWIWGKDGGQCWIEKGVFNPYNLSWLQKYRPGSFVAEHVCCRASLAEDLALALWFKLLKAGQPGVIPGSHGTMLLAGVQHVPPCFPPNCPQQLLQYIVGSNITLFLLTSSHSYSPSPLLRGAIIFFSYHIHMLTPPFVLFLLWVFLLCYFLW